jgi:hypothetical protein
MRLCVVREYSRFADVIDGEREGEEKESPGDGLAVADELLGGVHGRGLQVVAGWRGKEGKCMCVRVWMRGEETGGARDEMKLASKNGV